MLEDVEGEGTWEEEMVLRRLPPGAARRPLSLGPGRASDEPAPISDGPLVLLSFL
jgi:hypothetical protein